MNRRPDAPDPLTAEERELADRLLRLGPHDGPSPALDARILAAAHAAVAQAPRAKPRSRWPAWIGVAASLTLAVGVAWQLRPAGKSFEAVGEAETALPASAPTVAADAEADSAASAAMQAQDAAAPPAPAGAAADAPAAAAETAAAKVVAPSAPASIPPAAEQPAADAVRRERSAEAAKAEQRVAEPLRARRAPQAFSPDLPEPVALPAPPPPPAPPAPPAPAAAAEAAPPSAASGADGYGWRHPQTQNAPAPTPTAVRKAAANAAPAKPAEARAAEAPAAADAADSGSLDRVQVTGSRIGTLADDARLAPAQWLERIREYRDTGQTERARDSLRRFRTAHPQTRIPDDLRPLLR